MVKGNPAALLWINYKTKKIWKKYNSKEGKYKKAHKEASIAYCKKHPKNKETGLGCLADNAPIFFLRPKWVIEGEDILMFFHQVKHLINRHVNHLVDCHRPAFIPARGPTIGH